MLLIKANGVEHIHHPVSPCLLSTHWRTPAGWTPGSRRESRLVLSRASSTKSFTRRIDDAPKEAILGDIGFRQAEKKVGVLDAQKFCKCNNLLDHFLYAFVLAAGGSRLAPVEAIDGFPPRDFSPAWAGGFVRTYD